MCGIVGVYGVPDASRVAAHCLHSLQHRGQEAAGTVSAEKKGLHRHRGPGLVEAVYRKIDFVRDLPGHSAIGHLRYSTSGDQGNVQSNRSIQPLMDDSMLLQIAVVHNGNLTNADALRLELERSGAIFNSRSDTEVFLHLIKRSAEAGMVGKLVDCFRHIEGSYSVLMLTPDRLYAAVDPHGFRPLCFAPYRGGLVFASETCALELLGIAPERVEVVEPGTVLEVVNGSLRPIVTRFGPSGPIRRCSFEMIYFARPDSRLWGESVSAARERMGRLLAKRHPAPDADLVIPIPDSANSHALGFAKESGLEFGFGLVRSHYIGRTFIEPSQADRVAGIRKKLNADRGTIAGKSLVVVDDSIVRGNTTGQVVALLREAGARRIHLRIASPPVVHPCYWGIDTPSKGELIAANYPVDTVAAMVGADSLGYLTVEDLSEALGDRDCGRHCLTCFNAKHPTAA